MANVRENFAMMFLGHNRTGKTSVALSVARLWKKTHKGKNVICYDPQVNKFQEVVTHDITNLKDSERLEYLGTIYDSLVIFDDYRVMLDNDRTPSELLDFLQFRNERCNDVIFITHSPSLVLTRMTTYLTHYYIFYTQSLDKGFSDKIPSAHMLVKLKDLINKYVKNFGKGIYIPATPAKSFPYIVFDTERERYFPVNFTFIKRFPND